MKIEPLFDRVVLEKIKEEPAKTTSGLVLPESNEEKPLKAKVIAIGDGKNFDGKETPIQVEIGDIVLYSKYSGVTYKFKNKEAVIIRQNDILAKIIEE